MMMTHGPSKSSPTIIILHAHTARMGHTHGPFNRFAFIHGRDRYASIDA